MKSTVLLLTTITVGAVSTQTALADEYRGTMEQQLACTPDVWRLCSAQIPDVNRIVACLRQNTPQLSDGCRAVFESNNSASQQPAQPHDRPRAYGDVAQPPPRNNGWLR